eukprot:5767265-Prymnesium_polylepis.1
MHARHLNAVLAAAVTPCRFFSAPPPRRVSLRSSPARPPGCVTLACLYIASCGTFRTSRSSALPALHLYARQRRREALRAVSG